VESVTEVIKVEEVEEVKEVEDTTVKAKESNLFDLKAAQKLKEENAQKLQEEKEAKAQKVAEKAKEEKEKAKRSANLNGKYPFINFYSAPTNMYEVLENAEENNDNDILPNRFKRSVDDGLQNVYVHSTDGDTWISYQSDEEDIKRFVLKKGRAVLIKGKVVLLFMGNLNVAKIFLNNKLINAESKTGVKSIIFPQSEAKNYELPLFPSYKGIPMKSSVYKENMAEAPTN
jgi:cytoskeleton protein RodZ